MREYIDSADTLLDAIWSDKNVDIVQKNHNLGGHHFCLIDVSLQARGCEQHKEYLHSGFFRANIRRGNTLIENLRQKNIDWARKGTPNIFLLHPRSLQLYLSSSPLSQEERHTAAIIFEPVNNAFKEGKKVELIATQKVNGYNSQVSYNYDFNAWVICSSNVSLLAARPKDLSMYKGDRYKHALLVADEWFKLLKPLSPQNVKNVKQMLDGRTLVGEYYGHPLHRRLIKYNSIGIKWFALVDNLSGEFCTDPFQMQKQLQKFGFQTAKMKSKLVTSSPQQFYKSLDGLLSKTLQAGIEDQQYGMEGSVVYFLAKETQKEGKKGNRVVGAAKLKTLEYRFFQKIQQKLLRFTAKKETPEELSRKFRLEIQELEKTQDSRAPYPVDYYAKILKAGMELIEGSGVKEDYLKSNYLAILKVLFYSLYKKIGLKQFGSKMLSDQTFVDRVSEISFSKYSGLGCSTKIIYIPLCLPGMFKSYLGKNIAPHFQKLEIPYRIVSFNREEDLTKTLELINLSENEKDEQKSPILQHYFLDGCFDPEAISSVVTHLKKLARSLSSNESFLKFVLIKDQIPGDSECFSDQLNKYPFRLQTIIMSYYGQHQKCLNSPKLQQKVDNLKKVTEQLRRNRNFNQVLSKINIQPFDYPFSRETKIPNENQFLQIIRNILKLSPSDSEETQKLQFNTYCSLILRLEQIQGIGYLEEDNVHKEVEYLIKSSYPAIPKITFKK